MLTDHATRIAELDDPFDNVLDRLSERARERLDRLGRPLDVDVGATILREGEDTPFLGLVRHGRVALRLRVPELGRSVTIVTVEPGELLGWSAIVPPYRATVDAVATQTTSLTAFDAAELRTLLQAYPTLAAELPPLVLEAVSRRLTSSWTQLLDLFAKLEPSPW